MIIPIHREGLVIDKRAMGEWCQHPYHNHPKGCPNYGKRATCPPQAPPFDAYINVNKLMLIVAVRFDLGAHVSKMMIKHPGWSVHQLRCVLYWQGKVRAELRREITKVSSEWDMIYTLCPEAMGMNVIKTVKPFLPDIKFRPDNIVYKIGVCGYPA